MCLSIPKPTKSHRGGDTRRKGHAHALSRSKKQVASSEKLGSLVGTPLSSSVTYVVDMTALLAALLLVFRQTKKEDSGRDRSWHVHGRAGHLSLSEWRPQRLAAHAMPSAIRKRDMTQVEVRSRRGLLPVFFRRPIDPSDPFQPTARNHSTALDEVSRHQIDPAWAQATPLVPFARRFQAARSRRQFRNRGSWMARRIELWLLLQVLRSARQRQPISPKPCIDGTLVAAM